LETERRIREFELIAELFAPLATSKAALGLKDDVALLRGRAADDLVLTTDTIVEGIDFFARDPADTVAKKALRVNLSDLAAKGATPVGYLLTLVLPKRTDLRWLRSFTKGLRADQRKYGIALLGGDVSATRGPLSVSITALGSVPKGKAILRSGARPGDLVFVTGTIGDSGGGLAALKLKKREASLIRRYRVPEPRVAFGRELRGIASAAIDVSDGLLADLGHLADVSNVHIVVEATRIPTSTALRSLWGTGEAALARAATAGDDYEIAFTASPKKRARILAAATRSRTHVTEIGVVKNGRGATLIGSNGRPLRVKKQGWQHF
jgi:thiamine-monophosphate kinase